MPSVHAARRHRWRLAGGRLHADPTQLRFVPGRLERLFGAGVWAQPAPDVTAVRTGGRFAVVVETATEAVTFRLARPGAAAALLNDALKYSTTP